jgi:hypothetical protein
MAHASRPSPGPVPSALRVSSAPAGHNTHGLRPPPLCHHRPGSRPAPNAAASRPGSTGVSRARRCGAPRSWRGPPHRCGMPAGPRAMTRSNASRGKPSRPPCGRAPAHGAAACRGVGQSAPRTRSLPLSRPASVMAHHCVNIWHRHPAPASKDLDSPPQGMCSARPNGAALPVDFPPLGHLPHLRYGRFRPCHLRREDVRHAAAPHG